MTKDITKEFGGGLPINAYCKVDPSCKFLGLDFGLNFQGLELGYLSKVEGNGKIKPNFRAFWSTCGLIKTKDNFRKREGVLISNLGHFRSGRTFVRGDLNLEREGVSISV